MEVLTGRKCIPCILDTGSQVTLFSETFLKIYFKGFEAEMGTKMNWLKVKAAIQFWILKWGGLMFHRGEYSLFLMTVWAPAKGCWA